MRIGITYDLKQDYISQGFSEEEAAEFDSIETIEGIESALIANGHEAIRIGNILSLIDELHSGKRWDMVFNICEGINGIGREAQVPALLDAYGIPYTFSDVLVNALTLHKGMTKRVIRDLGIATAGFEIVETIDDISKITIPFPLFIKPVSEGSGKGISDRSKVLNLKELHDGCVHLLDTFNQAVLVEEFLPGREFTVGIVGTGNEAKAVGLMEVVFRDNVPTKIYSYNSKINYKDLIDYTVPDAKISKECFDCALAAWKGLGCRDGGRIDIRFDKNNIANFIEVNPLAGLNPVHSDLPILSKMASGISYIELIGMIVKSAIKRINHDRK
jgi:D-alanine-D-alanine ligase